MAYDPELLEKMREVMKDRDGITERKMFGGYMWMLNGNMLCGVDVGRFMFRVGKAQEAEALAKPGASPMDITKRPMGGFVWVRSEEALRDGLEEWIAFASRFVGALAAK
ncbi:MAG: TfoX/Sxy family protein [Magnetococcales bacterium]|nr:TfoX/Sxy family protein [Magnetococcales bacterium]MBF0149983.1 TfoX/Sxy family protein [Magnetococcales bacterium]